MKEIQPKNLKEVLIPCPTLFVEGEITEGDFFAVAIVGSRSMSEFGRKKAREFASFLAKNKVTIVSGMAKGIDAEAHRGALSVHGRTIAVLGSGLDVIYPAENKDLYNSIIKSGAVVSEYPLGTKPLPQNFLARNRIISALSLAVLVVEGAKRSGTRSTAGWAADQGREVFAIPGDPAAPNSYLPNFLIENGARAADSPEVILKYLLDTFV